MRFGPAPAARPRSARSRSSTASSPDGRVRALRLPMPARVGHGGSFAFGTSCAVVSFNYLQMSSLQLGGDAPAGMPDRPGDDLEVAQWPGADQCSAAEPGVERAAGQLAVPSSGRERADHRPTIRIRPFGDATGSGRARRSCSMRHSSTASWGVICAVALAARPLRSARCRCCSATGSASGPIATATSP